MNRWKLVNCKIIVSKESIKFLEKNIDMLIVELEDIIWIVYLCKKKIYKLNVISNNFENV